MDPFPSLTNNRPSNLDPLPRKYKRAVYPRQTCLRCCEYPKKQSGSSSVHLRRTPTTLHRDKVSARAHNQVGTLPDKRRTSESGYTGRKASTAPPQWRNLLSKKTYIVSNRGSPCQWRHRNQSRTLVSNNSPGVTPASSTTPFPSFLPQVLDRERAAKK